MKHNNIDNKILNLIFLPNKISRWITILLVILINSLIGLCIWFNGELFDAKLLLNLSEFSMTVILAIVALGISVFQSDNTLVGGNSKENKREIFVRYIFIIFPTIAIIILGFVVAILFEKSNMIIRIYSFLMISIMLKSITGTMASFLAFFKIKD